MPDWLPGIFGAVAGLVAGAVAGVVAGVAAGVVAGVVSNKMDIIFLGSDCLFYGFYLFCLYHIA